ncbi:MAG TPA: NAD-dependent epimerase/dehydratase family protein [Elusimicrobiota bacterium]|nr:NAD-dependent epimerase/dehydratase family protein [Elusimicrobiota bacterium]
MSAMGFWDGKRVLVTGGAGFIGSHLVERLLSAGRGTRVTVASRRGAAAALPHLAAVAKDVRLEKADLSRPEDCARACKGQDVVLHLAARVGGVGYNVRHPATMFRDNVRMTTHMLQAAQEAGAERFLLVSSACVYPRVCAIPTPETEGFSGSPEETNAGYGWAKRMAEFEAAATHKEFGMRVAIARPYNAYGPRDDFEPETSHVIPALIRKVLSGQDPVPVWGDGRQTRAFLYVDDFVRGLLDVTERYAECDPLNLGSDEETSIGDLTRMIVELCGSKAALRFDSSAPQGQPRRCCDTTKARSTIGFRAEVPLREGLRRTIEWYRRTIEAKPGSAHV